MLARRAALVLFLGLTSCTSAQVPSATAPLRHSFSLDLAGAESTGVVVASPGQGSAPSGAPSGEVPPAPDPSPPAPAPSPASATGGGSSGGGSRLMGRVLDEAEVPVAGATVRLADGTQATTDARGGFTLRGDPSFTMIEVAKAGYATSQVHGLTALPDLHLRSAIGLSQPFVRRTERFTGTIGWPAADLSAGTVYYVDDRRNSSLPGQLAADGSFAVQMKQDSAGAPVAVLFAVAKDLQGRDLVGYSAPFSAFGGTAPTTVAMALADQPIAYQGTATPTGLSEVRASLDVLQAGGSPLTIATRLTASGTFFAPLTGLLPGTMRVTLTARDPAGDHESILAVVPSSGQADGIWLAPPTAQVNAATRTISWVVDPAAGGYRLEVRHDDTTGPRWEGFTRGNTLTVPAEAWPASGAGEIHLQAIATSDFSARTIASVPARALRVAPWEQQVSFRMAQHRVRL